MALHQLLFWLGIAVLALGISMGAVFLVQARKNEEGRSARVTGDHQREAR
jgi:hypothetical protein